MTKISLLMLRSCHLRQDPPLRYIVQQQLYISATLCLSKLFHSDLLRPPAETASLTRAINNIEDQEALCVAMNFPKIEENFIWDYLHSTHAQTTFGQEPSFQFAKSFRLVTLCVEAFQLRFHILVRKRYACVYERVDLNDVYILVI